MPGLGPYSRAAALSKIDGRSRESRLVRSLRAELIEHVGGSPTAPQKLLIEQAVQLQLHIAMIDRKLAEGKAITAHDSRTYLAWCNSLSRLLRHLGLKTPAKHPPVNVKDYISRRQSAG